MASSQIISRIDRKRQQLEKDVGAFLDDSRTTPLNVPSILEPHQNSLEKVIKALEVNAEDGMQQHEQWVKAQLPAITEAAFRTKHIEGHPHTQAVQRFFQAVLHLIALGLTVPPSSTAATCLPVLIDLLVLLMGGQPSTKYAEPLVAAQLAATAARGPKSNSNYDREAYYTSKIGTTFYKDHGKPRVCYIRERRKYFWEDDDTVVYGEDQVGWHLEILDAQQGSQWVPGVVKEYYSSTNEHLVRLDNGKNLRLHLKRYDIRWHTSNGSETDMEGARLKDSEADVGVRVKIYWRKYNTYYAGTISAFDPSTGRHTVLYDDGDCRDYDMSNKIFSILTSNLSPVDSNKANQLFSKSEDTTGGQLVNETEEEIFAARPPAAQGFSTSLYLINNMNHFGRIGGFSNMTERLFDLECTFKELSGAISVVHCCRAHLTADALQAMVWDLKEAGPRLLVNLSETELKEMGKDDLGKCIILLKDLVVYVGNEPDVSAMVVESIDRLNLDLTYRQFTSTQLEKRLNGLLQIKDIVEVVQERERLGSRWNQQRLMGGSRAGQQQQRAEPPSWATPAYLRKWLLKSGIVAELFGPSMHVELVKRAGPILSFLASQGALGTRELEAIWSCAAGRHHEATTRVLYDLIGDLVPVLRPRPRAFLFSLIASLPISRYDEQALHLIYHFTVKALEARRASEGENLTAGGSGSGSHSPQNLETSQSAACRKGQVVNCPSREWFGFGLIWTFLQDLPTDNPNSQEELVSKEITELGMTLLVQLLQEREVSVERGPLIQKCLENLRAHRSVAITLQVLVRTISTQPQQQRGWLSRGKDTSVSSVLEGLQQSNQLMDLFFQDLEHYHNSLRDRYGTSTHSQENGALDNSVASGWTVDVDLDKKRVRLDGMRSRFTHLGHVKARLEFLTFVLTNSSLVFYEKQVDRLWQYFVDEAPTTKTTELAMAWFRTLARMDGSEEESGQEKRDGKSASFRGGFEALPDSVLEYLFKEKLGKFSPSKMNYDTADLFFDLFIHLNSKSKALKKVALNTGRGWIRQSEKLDGIHILWSVALEAEDARVTKAASSLLIELHHNLSSKIKAKGDIYGTFVRVCLNRIAMNMTSIFMLGSPEPPSPQSSARSSGGHRTSGSAFFPGRGIPETLPDNPQESMANTPSTPTSRHGSVTPPPFPNSQNIADHPTASLEKSLMKYANRDSPRTLSLPPRPDELTGLEKKADSSKVVARAVLLLRQFVDRFHEKPQKIFKIEVKAGQSESVVTELSMEASATVGDLREAVAEYFNESPSVVILFRHYTTSRYSSPSLVKLEDDAETLEGCKFTSQSAVVARKKDISEIEKTKGKEQKEEEERADLIEVTEIVQGFQSGLDPLLFYQSPWEDPKAVDGNSKKQNNSKEAEKERAADVSEMTQDPMMRAQRIIDSIPPPLPHKPEMSLDGIPSQSPKPPQTPTAAKQPPTQSGITALPVPLELPLTSYLKESPHHFDQLFSILDLNLSIEEEAENINVGANIWHILQSLPTHTGVLEELRTLNQAEQNLWHVLLEPTSLYKLLYSLQVVDAFLSSNSSSPEALQRWVMKFLHLGGVDHLLVLFRATSQKILNLQDDDSLDKSKIEALTLCITLLFRILQQLYGFDAEFRNAISATRRPRQFSGVGARGDLPTLPSGTVIDTSELTKLVHTGLDVLVALCKEGPPAWALLSAVASGCKFIVNCICFDRADNLMESYEGLGRFVSVFTLKLPNRKIRSMACFFLYYMCLMMQTKGQTGQKSPTGSGSAETKLDEGKLTLTIVLLGHLLPLLPSVGVDTGGEIERKPSQKVLSAQAGEYFALVTGLLHLALQNSASISENEEQKRGQALSYQLGFDPDQLVDSVTEALLDHQCTETFHSPYPDRTFIGLMMLLASLVQDSPERKLRVCEPDFLARVSERKASLSTPDNKILKMNIKGAKKVYDSLREAMNSRSTSAELNVDQSGLTLLSFLYKSCLFPPTDKEGPVVGDDKLLNVVTIGAKCKTPESRKMAYILLAHLCLNTERNFMKLMEMMGLSEHTVSHQKYEKQWEGLQMLGSKIREWDYNPVKDLKDPEQYVGLRNQGATCYMNSLIQQLYHTPHFKQGLLLVQPSKKNEDIDETETVLFQLQVLFSFLALSQKKYFDTKPFCNVIKDGQEPVNVGEQKDVHEFCGMLFEALESSGPEADEVTKESFGGTIHNQVICKECNYTSNRPEDFFMLAVDIKNKGSLQEALELYIAGDTLTGDNQYFCEACAHKVDAVRRCVIKDLPETLIIHLKRFDFEFETFTKIKLNDYCSFPMDLDMSPYTEKGLREKEKASIVQQSSIKKLIVPPESDAKSGEDTSEVKDTMSADSNLNLESAVLGVSEQKGEDDPVDTEIEDGKGNQEEEEESQFETPYKTLQLPSVGKSTKYKLHGIVAHHGSSDSGHYYSFIKERGNEGRWFEFNDKIVVPFKEEDIPKACFGGVDQITGRDGKVEEKERHHNAYLLFYDRQSEPEFELESIMDSNRLPKLLDSPGNDHHMNLADLKAQPELPLDSLRKLPTLYKNESSMMVKKRNEDLYLPPRVLQAVWKENVAFFSDRFLFDNDFLCFVWNILNAPVLECPGVHAMIIQVGLGVGAEVVAHARAKKLVPVWLDRLKQVAGTPARAEDCLSLLANQKDLLWLKQGLVGCPNSQTRKAFAGMISFFIMTAQSQSDHFDAVTGVQEIIGALVSILAKKFKEAEDYNLQQLYELMLHLCHLGPHTRRTLLAQDAVGCLARHAQAQVNAENKNTFIILLRALSLLVCSSDVWISTRGNPSSYRSRGVGPPPTSLEGGTPRVELSRDSLMALLNGPFLEASLIDCTDVISEILNHLCWDRSDDVANKLTKLLVEKLLESTHGVTLPAYKAYMQVLSNLLHMRDSLVGQRLQGCLSKVFERTDRLVERQGTGDAEFLYELSKVLLSLALTVPEASKYIYDNKHQWKDWAIQYLNEKVGRRQTHTRGNRSY